MVLAGHRGDLLLAGPVPHEERLDQVGGRHARLANEVPHPGLVAQTAHAGDRKRHGRSVSPALSRPRQTCSLCQEWTGNGAMLTDRRESRPWKSTPGTTTSIRTRRCASWAPACAICVARMG